MADNEFNRMMDDYVSRKRKSDSKSFFKKNRGLFQKERKVKIQQMGSDEYINVTDESFKNPEIEEQKGSIEKFFEKISGIFSQRKDEVITEEEMENIDDENYSFTEQQIDSEPECEEVTVKHSKGFFTRVIKKVSCLFKKDQQKDEDTELHEETEQPKELDNDVVEVLNIVNELFKKLPHDVKEEFKSSNDFETYARVLKKYHVAKKK
jgi:hypothetical protein